MDDETLFYAKKIINHVQEHFDILKDELKHKDQELYNTYMLAKNSDIKIFRKKETLKSFISKDMQIEFLNKKLEENLEKKETINKINKINKV